MGAKKQIKVKYVSYKGHDLGGLPVERVEMDENILLFSRIGAIRL